MKNKITALLLSVVLCLSLTGSVFAADLEQSDDITISAAAGDTQAVVTIANLEADMVYSACTLTLGRDGEWTPITNVSPKAKTDGTWKKTITGLPELEDGDVLRFNMPTLGKYGKLELEAAEEQITITYNVNKPAGADGEVAGLTAPTKTVGKGGEIGALPALTLDGYTLDGWNTAADGGGDAVTAASSFEEDTEIFAQWTKDAPKTVAVTGVTLDQSAAAMESGDTLRLTATVLPADAGNKRVTWSSSNAGVAAVEASAADGSASAVVTAKNAGTAVITVTTADGGKTATCAVTVTGGSSGGSVVGVISGGGGGGNGVGKPSVNANANPQAPAAETPAAVSFPDVPANHTFAADIAFVATRGWMGGYSDGAFRPNANTTRQALWMVLARIDGANPADMAAARAWAVANGISDGTNPGGNMSRQQMVAMLYRYAQLKGYSTAGGVSIDAYPDAASVANYAKDAMSWAIGNGIVNGTTDGRLNPTGTAIRAHFAAFLHRFASFVER